VLIAQVTRNATIIILYPYCVLRFVYNLYCIVFAYWQALKHISLKQYKASLRVTRAQRVYKGIRRVRIGESRQGCQCPKNPLKRPAQRQALLASLRSNNSIRRNLSEKHHPPGIVI